MLHAMFQGHKTSGSGEDFEGLFHIWVKRPSWSCDLDHLFPRRLHTKFGFDLQSGFREDRFENGGHIHVYSPRAGADTPLGQIIFH